MFGLIKKIIKKSKNKAAEKKYGNMKFEKIVFGTYPQSEPKNPEPIEWLVLKTENGKSLLLSDKVLHAMWFDDKTSDFSKSEVRNWLNGPFLNTAFSEEEKSRMVGITELGDKVCLMSLKEVTECLPAQSLRQRPVTNVVRRIKHAAFNKKTGIGSWMLLTPSDKYKPMASVHIVGLKGEIDPLPANLPWGVVPAIVIKV